MIKVFTIKFIKLPKKFKEISETNKKYPLGEASQLYFDIASKYPELANRQIKLEVFDSLIDQSYSIDVSLHLDLSLADLIVEQIDKTIAKTEDKEQFIELKKRLLTAFKTEILASDDEFIISVDESLQKGSSQNELATESINLNNLAEASHLTATDIAALALDETDLNVEDGDKKLPAPTSEVLNITDSKAMKMLDDTSKEDVKSKMVNEDLGVTADLELLLLEFEECTKDISEKVSQKLTDKVNERIKNVHTEIKGIENTLLAHIEDAKLAHIEDAKLEFDMSLMKDLSDQIDTLHDKFIIVKSNVTSLLETKLGEMHAMTKKANDDYYQFIVELTIDKE